MTQCQSPSLVSRTDIQAPCVWLLILAIGLLWLVVLMPGNPEHFTLQALQKVPLEVPGIVLLLMYARHWLAPIVCLILTLILATLTLLRLADIGSYMAFGRRFSPVVEWHLLGDGWNLASQSIGLVQAVFVVVVALLLVGGLFYLLYRSLRAMVRVVGQTRHVTTLICIGVLLVGGASLLIEKLSQSNNKNVSERTRTLSHLALPVQVSLGAELIDRVTAMHRSIQDQTEFLAALAFDPLFRHAPSFSALAGRDVTLIFVESYGRSFVEAPRFSELSTTRLAALQQEIKAAGLHVRSAWLRSPIRGGRSWLAHATFTSGLRISNQARFDRLVSSDRQSLNGLFKDAGWQTAGVMPAIQFAWPEGAWYGFDQSLTNSSMQYKGEKFGWVTMPDQYTLSAFEKLVREPAEKPVMAKIALISSHAPWTPLSNIVPWDIVGDGSVFDGSQRYGGPVVWSKPNEVRAMYGQSLDYTLTVLGQYLSRHGEQSLTIIVGDHQPPPIINGWGKTADVPIHIIADDAELLARLTGEFWVDGMLPAGSADSMPMEDMREVLARSFEDK